VLVERGEEPVVLTVGDAFRTERSVDGYRIYRYPWKFTGTFLDKGIRWVVFPPFFLYIVWKEKPDIIHAHAVSALTFVVGVCARMLGIPSVVKFAGDWVWETMSTHALYAKDLEELKQTSQMARILTAIERYGVKNFTVQWAPSEFREQNIRTLLGEDASVVRIPNSLALPRLETYTKHKKPGRTVVSANRFIPHKRVALIASMFARVAGPEDTLVLIGTGAPAEVAKVTEAVSTLPCADRIILTGRLSSEEVYAQFAQADMYVSASLEEGFPNVFVEAMHFGLPIVATDVGGCREMVQHDKTGLLSAVEDDRKLEEHMGKVLHDDALRARMADASREAAKAFDLTVVVDQFIALYKKLAQKTS
jgi:glycosyltransferase involved in cell wall biosynthesis